MSAPAWANDLVATVCADAGVPPPRLLWRVRRGGPSTGVARLGLYEGSTEPVAAEPAAA